MPQLEEKLPAEDTALFCQHLVVAGKVKMKANLIPDDLNLPNHARRRGAGREEELHTDHELQLNLGSPDGSFGERDCPNRRSRDEDHLNLKRAFSNTTLINKPGTPRAEVSVDGESSSILFSRGLMGLSLLSHFLLQLVSSSSCKSCFEELQNWVHKPLNKRRLHNVCLSLTAGSSPRSFK